ncbi:hypothetical protein INT45_008603 [Circinella minor]|uniref:Uncharacterized protein n=1 Tax=Circinella minor TaxID=1195481 RepID=A0A8H7VI55_9FUNG|nr:hypothetical protein INT45_008603 [Circinella minor]
MEGRLSLLNAASSSVTREARRLFESLEHSNNSGDGSSSGPSVSTSPTFSEQNNKDDEDRENFTNHEDDDEQKECACDVSLETVAMKRLSNKFEVNDMDPLMNLMKNDDDILSRANNHIIKLISQKHLIEVEEETMKLLLSSAINLLVDDTVAACMVNVFSPGQLKYMVGEKQSWVGMDVMTRAEIDYILDNNSSEYMDISIKDYASETAYY